MPKLKTYKDIDRLFITSEIVYQDVSMQTECGPVTIQLPCKRRKATYGELLDLYQEHLENKPKRFFWYIIANTSYGVEMLDWSFIERKLKRIITIDRPFPLDGFICWYE